MLTYYFHSIHIIILIFWILGLLSIPSVLINKAGRPLSALSWSMGLLTLPFITVPLWWLFGRDYLEIKNRTYLSSLKKTHEKHFKHKSISSSPYSLQLPPSLQLDFFPPTPNNSVNFSLSPQNSYQDWKNAILKAKKYIFIEMYIWRNDPLGKEFLDLLIQKSEEGVDVRILVDGIGSFDFSTSFLKSLKKSSIKTSFFLPVLSKKGMRFLNFRNHKKFILIDGEVGFLGGLNIGQEYLQWIDVCTRIEGPSLLFLLEVFVRDWNFSSNPHNISDVTPYLPPTQKSSSELPFSNVQVAIGTSGPHQRNNLSKEVFFHSIISAQKEIQIMTPYFIPDNTLIMALKNAAFRGTKIQIVIPKDPDVHYVKYATSAFIPQLLDAGIEVFYCPQMIHAKILRVDHEATYLGSVNFDNRSFRLNFEMICLMLSKQLNEAVKEHFQKILLQSERVFRPEPSKWQRVRDAAFHLLSPLL